MLNMKHMHCCCSAIEQGMLVIHLFYDKWIKEFASNFVSKMELIN